MFVIVARRVRRRWYVRRRAAANTAWIPRKRLQTTTAGMWKHSSIYSKQVSTINKPQHVITACQDHRYGLTSRILTCTVL